MVLLRGWSDCSFILHQQQYKPTSQIINEFPSVYLLAFISVCVCQQSHYTLNTNRAFLLCLIPNTLYFKQRLRRNIKHPQHQNRPEIMQPIVLLSAFLSTALAAPLVSWSPALGEFYSLVDKHVQMARQEGTSNPPTCDLSRAVQPVAPTPLPAPDAGWKLKEVVIGRGVQVRAKLNQS